MRLDIAIVSKTKEEFISALQAMIEQLVMISMLNDYYDSGMELPNKHLTTGSKDDDDNEDDDD